MASRIMWILAVSTVLAGCTAFGAGHGMRGGTGAPAMSGGMMGPGSGGTMPMMKHMQAMDANRDGMVSRDEFLKAHQAMYDAMPKNTAGQVDLTAMMGMMGGMHGMPGMQPGMSGMPRR